MRARLSSLHVTLGAIAAALVVALLVTLLPPFEQVVAGRIGLLILITLSLNLLIGVAGLLSLASAAFMGIGAYGITILLNDTSVPFAAAVPLVVAGSGLLGWLLGTLSIRVAGFYLALTTLGFLTLFEVVLRRGGEVTGAGYGLIAPVPELFGWTLDTTAISAISVAIAGASVVFAASFLSSRTGRAWRLMKASPVAAELSGMNLTRLKTSAFAITAAAAALAGCFYAFLLGAVSPESFDLLVTVEQLVYVVVGGLGSVAGSVLGPLVLEAVPELSRSLDKYRELFFGVFLLVILILAPGGLAGLFRSGFRRLGGGRYEQAVRRLRARHAGSTAVPERDHSALRWRAPVALPDTTPAVEYRGVTVRYGGNVAVDELSFSVRRRTLHGLIGSNGAGKTTAINALTGQVAVAGGTIELDGEAIRARGGGVPTRALAGRGVARTFQTPNVIGELSALDNVKVGLYAFGRSGLVRGTLRLSGTRREEAEVRARSLDALARVGFDADVEGEVSKLSFGELRKLEIARAIAANPAVLLLDEPTSGLETDVADTILRQLKQLQADSPEPMTVIIVEHNVPLLFAHCDEVTAMAEGRAIASATPREIAADPAVRASYLGDQIDVGVAGVPAAEGS